MSNLLAITNPALPGSIGNLRSGTWISASYALQVYLRNFINLALGLGGLFFFFMFILGGYQYITAGGDKEAVQKAMARLRNSLIGIAILLSVFMIIWFVETIFGISIIQINIPNLIP
jgi:cytochrome bd-type quinol oxidase subunit 2